MLNAKFCRAFYWKFGLQVCKLEKTFGLFLNMGGEFIG